MTPGDCGVDNVPEFPGPKRRHDKVKSSMLQSIQIFAVVEDSGSQNHGLLPGLPSLTDNLRPSLISRFCVGENHLRSVGLP